MKNTLILMLSLALTPLAFSQAITEKNWINHPEIRAIREIYNTVNSLKLTKQTKNCEDEFSAVTATIYRDAHGSVRKYHVSGGTGDMAVNTEHYYSANGINRFTFITLKTANGTHAETRLYFDENNYLIYRDYRLLEGPGYPETYPLEALTSPEFDFQQTCL